MITMIALNKELLLLFPFSPRLELIAHLPEPICSTSYPLLDRCRHYLPLLLYLHLVHLFLILVMDGHADVEYGTQQVKDRIRDSELKTRVLEFKR